MQFIKTIYFLLLFCQSSRADLDLKPKFEHQINSEAIETHESLVEIGGVKFKKTSYEGRLVFVNLQEPEQTFDCSQTHLASEPTAIRAGVKLNKSTRGFVDAFRQYCADSRIKTDPDLKDVKLGVSIESQKPHSNDKEIYVKPLKKMIGGGISF